MPVTIKKPKQIAITSATEQNLTTVLVQDTDDELWIATVTNSTNGTLDTKWARLPPIVADSTQAAYPVPTDSSNQLIPNTINIKYTTNT